MSEQLELFACEARIDEARKVIKAGWVSIGHELRTIRDRRLYKVTHDTFEKYCLERWRFTDDRARKLIAREGVVRNLEYDPKNPTIVGFFTPPEHDLPLAPLEPLTPERQRIAWQRAQDTAPKGRITARHVRETVEDLYGRRARPSSPDDRLDDGPANEDMGRDHWDARLSDVVIPALGLAEVDPDRVASWSYDRREEWRERLTTAINALCTVRDMLDVQAGPRLIQEGWPRE